MSNKINIVGRTMENKCVIGGVFYLYDTLGLPLINILDLLDKKNYIPAWDVFIFDALKAGWKKDTILNRIKEGLIDRENKDEIINRIIILINSVD